MRVLHNKEGRIRYYCRNKSQGLGCSGRGSFLDTYEAQLLDDLAAFELPEAWQALVLEEADRTLTRDDDTEEQRRQLRSRLSRLKDLYGWGDLTREEYQAERDVVEQELARLTPVEQHGQQLERLAEYVQSLPTAWQDASQSQRNQLASLIYEEVWVDGPHVEYVKPRPEVEPLFQVRTGAAQPLVSLVSNESAVTPKSGRGDPDGERGRMIQRWDFPVDEPVSLRGWRRLRVSKDIEVIAARVRSGESLRSVAAAYGMSHETIRRVLARAGIDIARSSPSVPAATGLRPGVHHLPDGRCLATLS